MNLTAIAIDTVERLPLPDGLLRFGVNRLVSRTSARLSRQGEADAEFAAEMQAYPIAIHVDEANQQHYELPPAFFELVLGPRRKYSCCLYDRGAATLAQAEIDALEDTCLNAGLEDGQSVLELGCGWGSLSLYMAERYPASRIVSVSNSTAQRRHIEQERDRLGLTNLEIVTADMNEFSPARRFDRIVSVEMFEHMANWNALLCRLRGWIEPDGMLFIHVFSHRERPYRFDHSDRADWIASHFFTGGIMPSHGLIGAFSDCFVVDRDWRWNGRNYEKTARDWLARFDVNIGRIRPIFRDTYGDDAELWIRRWRLFFLATAGLFGFGDGCEWGVSHYRLRPAEGFPTRAVAQEPSEAASR